MPPADTASDARPALSREIWTVASVVTFGAFITQLDATIVNVSLSSLARDLRSDIQTIHWVTSGYLLALALVLPLNGWLVGRIGAKRLYIWCFGAFTLSSAMCGVAWSAYALVGFRILQGMSGGLLAPMSQLMMARVAGNKMAQVVGFAAMPVLLAPLLGPVAAGAILQYASWRWLFLVNVPVGIVAIGMVILLLPSDRGEVRARSLDLTGLLLLSPAVVMLLYAFDLLPSGRGIGLLVLAAALLVAFLQWARRKGDDAIIVLKLFRVPAFSAAVLVQFLSNGVTFTGQMLLPIYLIQACAQSPSTVGLLLAPLGLGMMCGYPTMGFMTKRFGIRSVSLAGAGLALAGTLPLAYLGSHGLVPGVFMLALFVRGAGMSAIGVPSVAAAYASVSKADIPMASTALNVVQRLGGPTLTTVMSTFLGWRLSSSHPLPKGVYMEAFLLLALFHIVLVLFALRLPKTMRKAPDGVDPNI